jgi:hypothetical protein
MRKIYLYTNRMIPYDKLRSVSKAEHYLKPGKSIRELDDLAHRMTDNQAAQQMQEAKRKLFNNIVEQEKPRYPLSCARQTYAMVLPSLDSCLD